MSNKDRKKCQTRTKNVKQGQKETSNRTERNLKQGQKCQTRTEINVKQGQKDFKQRQILAMSNKDRMKNVEYKAGQKEMLNKDRKKCRI